MTVLCVGNKRFQLLRLMRLCRRHKQRPKTVGFTNANEVLAWLKDNSADIALLDINRRDMYGITLAREIMALCKGIKIILISDSKENAVEAFQLHPSGYIVKPVRAESLKKEIDYALS